MTVDNGAELVLVSTPIGNLGDLPPRAVETLRRVALICCEDTRRSGRLLAHAGISGVRLAVTNDHTEATRVREVLELLTAGSSVAVVTDAGTPGISDPGSRLVRAAIDAGFRVSAVPGPAALVMALVISGFDTNRFVFEGFLPRSGRDRTMRIAAIGDELRTCVLYEAPHRIVRTIGDLEAVCGPDRQVVLARELTKLHEETWRGSLAAASTHLAVTAPRGEYVVVVEGSPPATTATDDDLRDALLAAMADGARRSDAVATVVAAHRVPKRRVYDIAVTLPRDEHTQDPP